MWLDGQKVLYQKKCTINCRFYIVFKKIMCQFGLHQIIVKNIINFKNLSKFPTLEPPIY